MENRGFNPGRSVAKHAQNQNDDFYGAKHSISGSCRLKTKEERLPGCDVISCLMRDFYLCIPEEEPAKRKEIQEMIRSQPNCIDILVFFKLKNGTSRFAYLEIMFEDMLCIIIRARIDQFRSCDRKPF